MDLQEIREYLKQNADNEEVKAFLAELKTPSLDEIKQFLAEDEEGRKWLQAEKDRAVSKGIETWKQKTLPSILDEEREKIRKELNPEETPEQKELRELKEQFEKERRERQRAELRARARDLAQEKGLPSALVDYFIGEDEHSTLENLSRLEQTWSQAVQEAKESVFKQSGRTPHPPSGGSKRFTREQIEKMTPEELDKNWSVIEKQLQESGGKLD